MLLRVLIVESDPEDLLFLEYVLIETEDGRHWTQWLDMESQGASTCSEAVSILSREPIDVILLNPNLGDSQGAATYRRITAAAPQIPVILLIEAADRDLAVQLVRDGLQDFVLKKQIECDLLAHIVRNAIERQRVLESVRSTTMTDALTGLLNRGAFYSLAERDTRLAACLQRQLLIIVAEPKGLSELAAASGDHARELAMVSAGDVLRGLAGQTGLAGRLERTRFALALFDTPFETVAAAWSRIHAAAAAERIAIGAAILEPAAPLALDVLLDRAASDLTHSPLTASAAGMRR